MAAKGFVLSGKKLTSDAVVYTASQGAVNSGNYFAVIGANTSKYRRNEIITTWELARDRLMKVMGKAANILASGEQLICKVELAHVKNYTVVKEVTATGFSSDLISVGFTYLPPTFTDVTVFPHGGRPQQLGTVGLDVAVHEIIHAYLRLNSKD